MDVTNGLHLVSVLGSLLFLLYMNYLSDLWMNIIKIYAVDGKIIGKEFDTNEGVKKLKLMWTQQATGSTTGLCS